jgi:hypothetical protein
VSPAAALPAAVQAPAVPNGGGGAAVLTQPAVQVPPGYTLQPVRQIAPHPVKQPAPPSMTLLYVWILLFGFVGTQLAWTLRPFFGSPGMKFSLYRDIDGNFYSEIIRTLAHFF